MNEDSGCRTVVRELQVHQQELDAGSWVVFGGVDSDLGAGQACLQHYHCPLLYAMSAQEGRCTAALQR
jgi:hypothetical protein